jgi:predicted nucleic acid-binding protein
MKDKNKVLIPLDVVELLKKRHKSEPKSEANTELSPNPENLKEIDIEFDVVEGFSTEEYNEFQKRLIEYPLLKKDLEYHRKSSEKHQQQMETILELMRQRNMIEGRDKKML